MACRKSAFLRPIAALALAGSLLSGCGPVELVASGISDGTKWVLDRTGRNGGSGPPPGNSPAQPPATHRASDPGAPPDALPPVTAAPVVPVTRGEPLR